MHVEHYRAPRLLKHAVELNKPVLLLNIGPTRADDVPEVDKIEAKSGEVLRGAVRMLRSRCVISFRLDEWADVLACVAFHCFYILLLCSFRLLGRWGGLD